MKSENTRPGYATRVAFICLAVWLALAAISLVFDIKLKTLQLEKLELEKNLRTSPLDFPSWQKDAN